MFTDAHVALEGLEFPNNMFHDGDKLACTSRTRWTAREVLRRLPLDSCPSHDAGVGFFFYFDPGSSAGPEEASVGSRRRRRGGLATARRGDAVDAAVGDDLDDVAATGPSRRSARSHDRTSRHRDAPQASRTPSAKNARPPALSTLSKSVEVLRQQM